LIKQAQQNDPTNTYIVADASQLPFADNSFDIITSFDNLEHIKEYRDVIKEMVRVLKPGGVIILNTINRNNKYTFDWLLEKMGSTYHLTRAGHVKELFFEPTHIQKLFQEAGLTHVTLRLFDATFVLIMDCILYIFLMIIERLSHLFFNSEYSAKIATQITDRISKISLPVLEKCDTVITKQGYSNAFFLIGVKPES
jgi:SAM-dependent methyltransferase